MIHRFKSDISTISLPDRFTNPFRYVPHPLVVVAAKEVEEYVRTRVDWSEELRAGKMFGVLVVGLKDGTIGYLAAFSGNIVGSNVHEFFVPPVYDLLQPDGFFKIGERNISEINHKIKTIETSEDYLSRKEEVAKIKRYANETLERAKEELRKKKEERRIQRNNVGAPLAVARNSSLNMKLAKESQFQKAEYKRLEQRLKKDVAAKEAYLKEIEDEITKLKKERKSSSAALQTRMFRQFRILNAMGETKDLVEIFKDTPQGAPPAGAGECALPKMLQFAYLNNLKPLAFGEFWCGDSPKNEVRKHGSFYPSCQGKCAPILKHALLGLEIEETQKTTVEFTKLYEDEWLVAVDKPAGMLSVPGKEVTDSVQTRLQEMYPDCDGPMLVHRLDMDTSGILIAAKTKQMHEAMQRLFETRQVKKRYTAILDGLVTVDEGEISLPLSLDYYDRPRQKVDYERGKKAVTQYKVRCRRGTQTLVDFYPKTGRTHQLRIHAAHKDGLNCPIVGDMLYGNPNVGATLAVDQKTERMYLHASELEFIHPVTGETIRIIKEPNYSKTFCPSTFGLSTN